MRDVACIKMLLAPKRLAFFLAAALLCAPSARALIVVGASRTDVDNTVNTTAPTTGAASGAPWSNVAQFGVNNGSAVYLGNGFVLTANHVNLVGSVYITTGVNVGAAYTLDPNFTPLHVTEGNPLTTDVDLKLFKILGTPPSPVVQNLPLNYSDTADLSVSCTIIGWGVGKDPAGVLTNQGWLWGDNTTRVLRWGTNTVSGFLPVQQYFTYETLYTSFNAPPTGASNEAQVTAGDSGGGLFAKINNVWKLIGLTTDVSTLNKALYSPPDYSYFVRISTYAHLLRYENWANKNLNSPIALLTADPDKDGCCNLLEYAFHTDPNAASTSALPQVGMEGGYVTLTYTQLLSATDLSYVVEESPSVSPASWSPATVIEETVSTSGMTRVVKAKVAIGAAAQKYLRLSVTKVP